MRRNTLRRGVIALAMLAVLAPTVGRAEATLHRTVVARYINPVGEARAILCQQSLIVNEEGIGGTCAVLNPNDDSVTISVVDDGDLSRVGFHWQVWPEDRCDGACVLASGSACDIGSIPALPAGGLFLRVMIDGPVDNALDCDLTLGTSLSGTVTVDIYRD